MRQPGGAAAHRTLVVVRAAVVAFVIALALAAPSSARADLSRPPKLLHFVEAAPPPSLSQHGRVEVVLTIDLDETGKIQSVTVAKPGPPNEGFDEAAVAAAKQFVFSPAELDGKPIPSRLTYRYVFLFKPASSSSSSSSSSSGLSTASSPPQRTVPFSGRVLSKGDRVPLAGVTVLVDDLRATTDADGRFTYERVPIGHHTVRLRGAQITATENPLELTATKKLDVTYYVPSKQRYQATVRGTRAVEETVEQTISADELKRIPGTQGDTLKAVQNLPGLARSPFGAGLLVVWGSAPFDTRVYADGVFIPTLYHFGGLRSTVNSEIVDSLTFAPGGYSVEHGRGLGGVIEIESRRPRTDGYHGFAQLDALDASAMFEGPISKNVSFAVGLRRSTIDAWLPYVTPNNFQLTPTYWDYQAKLHWRMSPRDDLDVFVFGSDDLLHLTTRDPDPNLTFAFDSHIYYHRALARWTHRFQNRATLAVTASLGYDVPFQFRGTTGNFPLSVDAETFEYTVRAVARVPLADFVRLDAGIDFEGNRATIEGQTPVSGMPREGDAGIGQGGRSAGYVSQNATINLNYFAPYVMLDFKFFHRKLSITPQLRVDVYDWAGYQNSPNAYDHASANIEPRLQLRYQIVKWAAIKAAVGVYHQPPDPSAFLLQFGNPSVPNEFALHYVLGADFDPTSTLHIEVEGFYKDLRDQIVRGEGPNDPPLVGDGIGRVYGAELLVRQELWKNFFGWIAYTVSRSERKDHPDEPWRIFQFDQTHILTLIASYKLPRGYQVGVRFRYVTGNPYTPTAPPYGFFDANTGSYRAVYGQVYSSRLPDFHQLDVRFDKTWTFNRWRLAVYLDLQNVYNNQAPEGATHNFNDKQTAFVNGLPIIPDLGIRGEF